MKPASKILRNRRAQCGQYHTPRPRHPRDDPHDRPELGETIYDRRCGIGGFLCEAL